MILDEKVIMYPPPPPYALCHSNPGSANPNNLRGQPAKLSTLSPHILLEIVYHTFPQSHLPDQDKIERQRKTLYWLSTHLRLVNRALYTACMHVLRSTYLPAYSALIRPPYTSDPFPVTALGDPPPCAVPGPSSSSSTSDTSAPLSPPAYPPSPTSSTLSLLSTSTATPHTPITSPLQTIQRETPILDRFIALKVQQDVFSDESELHLERQDLYKDLFDVAQPRARLEDLVRVHGMRMGLVSVPGIRTKTTTTPTTSTTNRNRESKAPPPSHSSPITLLPHPQPQHQHQPSNQKPQPHPNPQPQPQPHPHPRKSFLSLFKRCPSSPTLSPSPFTSHPTPPQKPKPKPTPIPFASLSISFSPRRVGLVMNRTRTIVEVPRSPGRRETLEVLAGEVVRGLGDILGVE